MYDIRLVYQYIRQPVLALLYSILLEALGYLSNLCVIALMREIVTDYAVSQSEP